MKQICLLVVDVQQALVDEGPEDLAGFRTRLKTLVDTARTAGVPVVHIQHGGPAGDELEPRTPGWAIADPVKPLPGEPVFEKRVSSAFKETKLESHLHQAGIGTLVIVGMQTEFCVDANIKAAFDRGFSVIAPEGAQTTFANSGIPAAKLNEFYSQQIWKNRFAQVIPVDAVVEMFKNN